MAIGDSAIFAGTASKSASVTWETDFAGSPAEAIKATIDICERDTPPTVARKLETAWNSLNCPPYKAEVRGGGAAVRFTDGSHKPRYVDAMRFTVAGSQPQPVPGNGPSVPVGNTGLSVKNANG